MTNTIKQSTMKQYLMIGVAAMFLLSSCGGSKDQLTVKKAEMEKLKIEKQQIDDSISSVQAVIDKLDTTAADAAKAKLVAVETIALTDFKHYIQSQGKVDALNISYIAPTGGPGVVKELYVQQGDQVKKGQLLLKLDDAVLRQRYNAAVQGQASIKTQLDYAKNILDRQQNLWNQGIGTEVQLLTDKSNVATLQDQLTTAQENAKTLLQQLNTTNVYSDVDGVADIVNVRVGETFSGATLSGPQIEIVNNSNLKVTTSIPENYLSNVKKGTAVVVQIPDINKTFNTSVSFVSASIDPLTRGFVTEAKLPADALLKPNQIALMQIKDYEAPKAIVVPVATLQNDLTGKFIMVASTENGKLIARKHPVTIGSLNDDQLEVLSGLKTGDVLITEGFQSLYDGQLITTQ
jgi:membrane fusion protein (multidrug efflux system)